ncbi:MAG TPA: transcriptional regulator [Candidatus Eisenbacteria bacterium]|nr:transcriptional regulator [Candidatus Eisenbacteria bacterium]
MKSWSSRAAILVFGIALLVSVSATGGFATEWSLIGPDGGNVRSLSYDPSNPDRMLLGTSAAELFVSNDGGNTWAPFAHLGLGDDLVIDHIVFDPTNPKIIYAAGWGLYRDDEGDVYRSDDGGATWKELTGAHGKSIRALAMAPSDHNVLVIGALDGVFRSKDGGATWERMTPENPDVNEKYSTMRNFVSVAIDPQNPDIVYAGTRHLAWKTSDGGKNWRNIHDGMLDDSDVFSIIVDPRTPSRVYASACSGIYKSDNAAELFHRVQGLPHSAIRTRVLKQDPVRSSIVYAGTTGGLWKTTDGGSKWTLVSSADVVVNDILIDPRNPERVLLATDRGGVLASNDGFTKYKPSNRGFSHRMVGAVITDNKDPNRLYVGIVNDKVHGGLFTTEDVGKTWLQVSRGLGDRDVLSLQQADNGVIFAGTNHGIFFLTSLVSGWQPVAMIRGPVPEWQKKEEPAVPRASKATTKKSAHSAARKREPIEVPIPIAIAPRVRSLEITDKAWYAATNEGLFISVDGGKKWYGTPVEGESDFVVANEYPDGTLTLAAVKRAFLSRDGGRTWSEIKIPDYVTGVYDFTMTPDSTLWLGTREGAARSDNWGASWVHVMSGLPPNQVLGVTYDASTNRLLATAMKSRAVFESADGGKSWKPTPEARFLIRTAMSYQGQLLAASWHNGLLLQKSDSVAATPGSPAGLASAATKSQR